MKSKSIRGDSVRALRSRAKSRKFQGRPEFKRNQLMLNFLTFNKHSNSSPKGKSTKKSEKESTEA